MLCQNCGQDNDEDGKFCIKCGLSLRSSGKKKVEDILFVPSKKQPHTLRNIGLISIAFIVMIFLIALLFSSDTSNTSTSSISSNPGTPLVSDQWQPFSSVEHGFTMDFPAYPSSERTPPQVEQGFTYSSTQYSADDTDGVTYLAQAADYDITPDNYDNKAGLEGIINTMDSPGEQVVSNSSFTKFRGYDAVSFDITSLQETYFMRGIAFIRDDLQEIKSFMLLVGSKVNYLPNYQKFINSFQFK